MRDELHWLLIPQHIRFRLSCIARGCIKSLGPSYLSELFILVSATLVGRSSLRSISPGDLLVPFAHRAMMKLRSFSVVCPTLCNGLPPTLRSTSCDSSRSFCI